MKHLPIVLAGLLLLLMGVLAGSAIRRQSVAIDEVAHLGAGVSYLQKLDLRMNQEHPALPKILAALPLVLRGVRTDYSNLSWAFSGSTWGNLLGEWTWGYFLLFEWNDAASTLFWGRLPMLLLTLLLGAVVYRYATRIGGGWGGVLCVAAYVSTPAFIVFGPLVLTDIPVALFVLLTIWKLADVWREPSRRNATLMGLCLTAAVLSKYSAGWLFVCILGFRLSLRWLPLPGMPADHVDLRTWRKLRGRAMWRGIFIAVAASYLFYLFFSWNQPSDSLQILGHSLPAMALRRLLMPAWLYFRGLAIFALSSPRATFLLGHNYPHAVWFYFPVVFALKSTLAFLLMLALTIPVGWIARRKLKPASLIPNEYAFHWRAVWTSLVLFLFACMLSPMSISIRHFTIPILLMILLMAPAPRALDALRRLGWPGARTVMAAYAALAVISIVAIYSHFPYFMPFVNSLGGGRPAYELVSDSNLDWSQALPQAAEFVRQRGIQHVLVDEYGFVDPAVYVPHAEFWDCQSPAANDAGQWAVVSAAMLLDGANCAWLLHYPHEAIAAGSMYAFQLPEVIPPAGDPLGPPVASNQRHWVGAPVDTRVIFMKSSKDPSQLQPTMDWILTRFREEVMKKRAEEAAKRKGR